MKSTEDIQNIIFNVLKVIRKDLEELKDDSIAIQTFNEKFIPEYADLIKEYKNNTSTTQRQAAMRWWNDLSTTLKKEHTDKYFGADKYKHQYLTGRQIEKIWINVFYL